MECPRGSIAESKTVVMNLGVMYRVCPRRLWWFRTCAGRTKSRTRLLRTCLLPFSGAASPEWSVQCGTAWAQGNSCCTGSIVDAAVVAVVSRGAMRGCRSFGRAHAFGLAACRRARGIGSYTGRPLDSSLTLSLPPRAHEERAYRAAGQRSEARVARASRGTSGTPRIYPTLPL